MRLAFSMRFKLIILYLLTVLVPVVIIIFIFPYYFNNKFTEQTTMLSEGTLTSITRNVEMYLDDLERLTIKPYLNDDVMIALKLKASDQYEQSSEYARFMAEKSLRTNLPRQLKNTRKDILGTILLPQDGSIYILSTVDRSIPVPDFPYQQQDWYQKAWKQDGRIAYISSHPQDYLQIDDLSKQVFSVARLLKDPDSGKPLGVIMTDAANIILENIIGEVKFNVRTIVAVLDENNKPIYSNQPLSDTLRYQLGKGQDKVEDENDTYRVVVKTMQKSGWRIAVLFSDSEFQSQLTWVYIIGAIFAGVGVLLTLFLNISLTHWIVNPFRQMVHIMKKVQRGDLDQRLTIRGKDEIAQLGFTLNNMIIQLKELIDREYRAVLGQRNAEYRALQSQIQPHFLYNTLNGFVGLNRSGQSMVLEKAILSLSSMMRYTLEHQDVTTVKAEMAFLQKYCELQQIRFQEKLHVHMGCDPRMEELHIPKLLLQPLVENAIIHGIEPLKGKGSLSIQVHLQEDRNERWLHINIEDNGVGFDLKEMVNSVGITNVRERLFIFDKDAAFTIQSTIGKGTKAEILMPWKDAEAG